MTNDSTYRKKANAVFFAAIMVVSMFAAGFAAAPVAAQSADTPELEKDPIHYESGGTNPVLELAFDSAVNDSTGNITVETSPGETTTFNVSDNAVSVTGGQVVIDTTQVFPRVGEVSFEGIEAAGGSDAASGSADARFAGATLEESDDENVFQGTLVAIENDSTDASVSISSDSEFAERSTGGNSSVALFDTSERSLEEYEVTGDVNANFTLRNLDLAVSLDDAEITTSDNITGTVSAASSDRQVLVELLDEDDEVVSEEVVTLSGNADADFDLGQVETGDYEIETTDLASGVTSISDAITVSEAPEGDISFEESFVTEERGDNANITINFEGDLETAYLTIGDNDDVGYEANITVNAEGEDSVTVGFNTYAAGNTGVAPTEDLAFVADSDSDATVTVESQSATNFDQILATGTYPFEMSDTSFEAVANENSDAVGDLELEERGVDSFNLWTTSTDVYEDVEDVEDITNGVENNTVVETESLTEGDVLIHELSATGLEGVIDAADGDSLAALITATDNADEGIDLRIRQTAATTAPNTERKQVNVSAMIADGDVDVISTEGSYFIAFEQSDIVLEDTDRSIEDGDAFDVRVRVKDERLLDPDLDELAEDNTDISDFYEVATVSFDYQEATGEFNTPVEVAAAENQSLSGTTNVAPGQEISVRVRSASGVSPGFVQTAEDVTVTADGEFTATGLDLSDASPGDEFTATVQQATFEAENTEGIVVESTDGGEGEATFEVSELNPQDVTATVGDTLTVTATIENTGDAEGTQTVEFRVGGNAVASQDVTLGAGNSTTVEFADVDTSALDAGEYEHGVFTDDGSQTATLTLEAAGGDDGGDGGDGGDDGGDGGDDGGDGGDDGTDNGTDDGGDDTTDDGTPGFGAIVALVALIAAALLATRRND